MSENLETKKLLKPDPGGVGVFDEKEVVMVRGDDADTVSDKVVREYPVTIYLNGGELVTLLCTPEKLDYLALGFMRSEGFIEGKADVKDIRADYEKGLVYMETREKKELAGKLYGRRTVTSGCGKGTTFFSAWDSLRSKPVTGDFKITCTQVLDLMRQMQERARVFRETGGVHSAALCDREKVLFFCEDIGRHNAIDKIVGESIWNESDLKDRILVSSGRLSSEMMLKAAKLEVPIVVSRSAPTTLGLEIAEKMSITVIGFVRGQRLNIYTSPERIILKG